MPEMPLVRAEYFKMEISENTVLKTKEADLVSIIGKFVKLKRAGSRYVGLCPFHNEKTPSFTVTINKGYKCFGCGQGGSNAVDFIMKYTGQQFVDAVIQIASMTGINVEKNVIPGLNKRVVNIVNKIEPAPIDYIPKNKIEQNLEFYSRNNLYDFFVQLFSETVASNVFKKYGIGSSKYYGNGTTCFIQKDIDGNIRQIKVMMYDKESGKRRQDLKPLIIGKSIMGKNANLVQCFFGEPLINEKLPIALCESEKTAALCSVCYPQFIWLATGGKFGCNMTNPLVNKVLIGKEIHLFPDVDGIEDWRLAADELKEQGFNVFLNEVMFQHAKPGSKEDIADLVLMNRAANGILLNDDDYPVIWNCGS